MMRLAWMVVVLAACGGGAARRPTVPPDTTAVDTTVVPDTTSVDTGSNTSAVDTVGAEAIHDSVISAVTELAKKPVPTPPTSRGRGVGSWNLPADSTCGPTYSATQFGGSASMGPALDKVARCKGWVVISVGRKVSLDANGLSAKAACANIAKWPDLTPWKANILAAIPADDINNDFNGVGAPRYAAIDSIARCIHARWAWLPAYVRQKPSGLKMSYPWRWLDGGWAQYGGPLHGDGTPEQYVAREEAAAKARGLGLILGLNGLDQGDGSSRIMGTFLNTRDNRWQATGAEMERAGVLFIKHSCVVLSWTWSPRFNYSRPAAQLAGIKGFNTKASIRAAFSSIRAAAPSAIPCPMRGAVVTTDPVFDSVAGVGLAPRRVLQMPASGDLYRLTGGLTRTAYFPVAPDSTVTLKVKVYGIKNFRSIDTLQYTYYRNDSLQVTKKNISSSDSAKVGAPAYGGTASYKACAQILIGGTTRRSPPSPACWLKPWVYTRPLGDATMDSVVQIAVRGRSLVLGGVWGPKIGRSVTDSARAQYCAFLQLKDGRRIPSSNSTDSLALYHPELLHICQEEYQQWLAERIN